MDKLDELERLLKAATVGKWAAVETRVISPDFGFIGKFSFQHESVNNAELIVAMRNNLEALIKVARTAKELADFNDQYLNNLEKNKIEWSAKDAESPYVKRIKLALAELDCTE